MNKKRLFSKQCYLAKGTRVWLGLKVMKAERKICWDEQKPKRKQQQIQAGLCWDCCFFPEAATLGFMTKTKTLLQTWSEALHLVQVSLKKRGFNPLSALIFSDVSSHFSLHPSTCWGPFALGNFQGILLVPPLHQNESHYKHTDWVSLCYRIKICRSLICGKDLPDFPNKKLVVVVWVGFFPRPPKK